MTHSVLILSPYFPPSTLAGVHRARLLAKRLPQNGWQPIILCVDEACQEQRLDPGLAALVPADIEIIKVPALPAKLTRPFGFGEISIRAWWGLRSRAFELLSERKIDAVLITGSPFYPMLLAPEIKKRFNIPVVLDFQDPWVSSWGARQKRWSKAGLSHRLAMWLEPKVLHGADFLTSVSNGQNAEMVARYPWLNKVKMAAIPIGGDPEDFQFLRKQNLGSHSVHLDKNFINISYVGSYWPSVEPTLRALFQGFFDFRKEYSELSSKVRLNFIGTDASLLQTARSRVHGLATEEGIPEAVHEVPLRVPYLDALTVLANSDVILLIGSDEPHYTASKIYPALMSGKPFLSLFHSSSSAHRILASAGGGVAISFDNSDQLGSLVPELSKALKRIATNTPKLECPNIELYKAYDASEIARQFAAIFESIQSSD